VKNTVKGIKLSLITAFVSGFSIFFNKFAVDSIKPVLLFTSVKNSAVFVLLFLFIIFAKKFALIQKLTKKELQKLFLIGIIGGGIPFYLYFVGLSSTSAINAALIHKSLVLWVALLAVPYFGEKLSFKQISIVSLIFFSNFIIGGFNGFKFSKGEFMILIATLLWSAENLIAKSTLKTVDAHIVTFFRMGVGSVVLLVACLLKSPQSFFSVSNFTSTQFIWLSVTVFSLLIYVVSWYQALKFAPATTVTAVLTSSTVITNILTAIFVNHNLNLVLTSQNLLLFSLTILFVLTIAKEIPYKELKTSLVQ